MGIMEFYGLEFYFNTPKRLAELIEQGNKPLVSKLKVKLRLPSDKPGAKTSKAHMTVLAGTVLAGGEKFKIELTAHSFDAYNILSGFGGDYNAAFESIDWEAGIVSISGGEWEI